MAPWEQFFSLRDQVGRTHFQARGFGGERAGQGGGYARAARRVEAVPHFEVLFAGQSRIGESFDEYCDGSHLGSVQRCDGAGPVAGAPDCA